MTSIHWPLLVKSLQLHYSFILALVSCMMLNVLLGLAVHIRAFRVSSSSLAADYSAHLSCLSIFFSNLFDCLLANCLMHLVIGVMCELFP